MGRRSASRAASLLLAIIVVSGGCRRCGGGRGTPIEGEIPRGPRETLRVHLETEPANLLSLVRPDAWAHRIAYHQIFESLVRVHPRTYRIVPELAASWRRSADGLRYTFTLAKGARWHDGKPVTSSDVRFTLDEVLDPATGAGGARAGLAPLLERVEAPDPRTVVIRCRRASWRLLHLLADVPILPAHRLARADLAESPFLRAPVGSGPYRFAAWDPGKAILLERHDAYRGPLPAFRRVVFRVVRDPVQAIRLARKGKLDLLPRIRPADYENLVRRDPVLTAAYRTVRHAPPGAMYLLPNHRRWPFADARVRRGLAHLLDRRRMIRDVLRGFARPLGSLFWVDDPAHDPTILPIPFDMRAARGLFDRAGFIDRDGDGLLDRDGRPLRFQVAVPASSRAARRWLGLYQEVLRKAGIAMTIAPVEWRAFLARLRAGDFDMAVLWMAQPDPYTDLYDQLHSRQIGGGQNYGGVRSPALDRALEAVRDAPALADRNARARELQRLLRRELPVIPLFRMELPGLLSRRVAGVYRSALWYQIRDLRPL